MTGLSISFLHPLLALYCFLWVRAELLPHLHLGKPKGALLWGALCASHAEKKKAFMAHMELASFS